MLCIDSSNKRREPDDFIRKHTTFALIQRDDSILKSATAMIKIRLNKISWEDYFGREILR